MTQMIRKLFVILLLCLLPSGLSAQLATGSWKVYGAFGLPDKLLETPQFVYLLTRARSIPMTRPMTKAAPICPAMI